MPLRKCATCGREFEKPFGDSSLALTCPNCTKEAAASQQPIGEVLDLVAPERPIITPVLIGLNVLVFAVMVARGVSWWEPTGEQGLLFGANFGPMTMDGQWWRLFTCMFVHFGILHIALNMWCLWNFGRIAEYVMGRASFLVAYLATGLFASVASLLWNPMRVSAGASGAIFGIAGALVPYFYFEKATIAPQDVKKRMGSLGTFILYNLVYGAGKSGIDYSAHLGGLIMGLIVGALLPRAVAARAPRVSQTGQVATPDFFPATQAADARQVAGAAPRPYPQSGAAPDSSRSLQAVLVTIFAVVIIVAGAFTASQEGAYAVELTSAEKLVEAGKYVPAIALLQKVVAEHPELAYGQYLLGTAYLRTGQYQPSSVALKAAVALEPDNFSFRHDLAAAYLGLEDYDQAILNFQKVVPKEGDDPHAHLGLGMAYLGKERFEEAIGELKKAVALSPESAGIQDTLGRAFYQAKKFEEAHATFAKVLEKHPDDATAQNGVRLSADLRRKTPRRKNPAEPPPSLMN